MKQKLKSLRFRMLLPVVAMTLFIVILLTTLFSRTYTSTVLKQEQDVNAVGFETVSHSLASLIESSTGAVRGILSDDRVASCARNIYNSTAEQIHARIRCRDYLLSEIRQHDSIYGLLFMRQDGSMFGVLPEANLFLDKPEDNPLPDTMKRKILQAPLGQTVWVGPVDGGILCGFRDARMPERIMIAAWKTVDVSYGECYAMMLMDESVFAGLLAVLEDVNSTWHLFAENRAEIYHTGHDECLDTDLLISESNSGEIFTDGEGRRISTFSTTMTSPAWILVREISMEKYEAVIREVRLTVGILGIITFIVALAVYELWLKKFMRQFRTLLKGISQMGQNESEPITSKPSSISEFGIMQQEINRTSLALNNQMDTIRKMTAEKEHINTEMNLAKNIQASALPDEFPAFPDRSEFDLFASMTPAKEVGGDFYDFFLIDDDHLALVIADVSGKGVPAALFMMNSKTLIKNYLMTGCDPAQAMQLLNDQFSKSNKTMMFVTVWLAVVEISTGKGLACNAGHEKPALRRSGGEYELLEYQHNMLVGGLKKARFQNRKFILNPGDSLLVYTDGVTEASNSSREMFGEKRLVNALNQHPDAKTEEMICHLHSEVDHFADGAEQFDDITMLCFRYNGAESREQQR